MNALTAENIARAHDCGAATIKQNNSVRDSLERLRNQILELEERTAILLERIEPVRTPEVREPNGTDAATRPKEHKSQIELAIDEAAAAVSAIIGRVNHAMREVSI